jgi:hypothetical protein
VKEPRSGGVKDRKRRGASKEWRSGGVDEGRSQGVEEPMQGVEELRNGGAKERAYEASSLLALLGMQQCK